MVAVVRRMVVAADDACKGFAQYFLEDLGAPVLRDVEENGQRRHEAPKIALCALIFPAGFVDVECNCGGHIALDGADRRPAGLGNTFGGLADGAGGDLDPEKGCPSGGSLQLSAIRCASKSPSALRLYARSLSWPLSATSRLSSTNRCLTR